MPKKEKTVNSGHIKRLKQQAKKRSKQESISHAHALEHEARNAGFANWKAVLKACDDTTVRQITTPSPSLDFVSTIDDDLSKKDRANLNLERSRGLALSASALVAKNRKFLASHSIEYSIFEPTLTGLGKSILDATQVVCSHFLITTFHDYATQQQGPAGKVVKPAVFLNVHESTETKVSLYRPITKSGDPRMWFSKLSEFASAGDQVAIIIFNDTAYLINFSVIDLEFCFESGDQISNFLHSFIEKESGVAEELIGKLRELAKSPIKAIGKGDKTIGMTIEACLGISANSSKEPDYKGIELKSGKGTKTRTNLFAQVADWKQSECKSSRAILEKYGYERGEDFKLYCTIRVDQPNSQGLKFVMDLQKDDLVEVDGAGDMVAVWPGKLLRSRLQEKHSETFWIQAEAVDINGEHHFNLKSVVHTKSPLLSQLMPLIGSGVITMDHLIKRKGGVGGKVSEKGPLFKIDKRNLSLLFSKPKKYSLT